jgi:hypothetical protein
MQDIIIYTSIALFIISVALNAWYGKRIRTLEMAVSEIGYYLNTSHTIIEKLVSALQAPLPVPEATDGENSSPTDSIDGTPV